MDETIEQLCTALLKHELMLKAVNAGTLRASVAEIEALRLKARRCENWITLLHGHLALERVKERAAAMQPSALPTPIARATIVAGSGLLPVERVRELPLPQRLAV